MATEDAPHYDDIFKDPLKKTGEKVPGLGYVTAAFSLVIAHVLHQSPEHLGIKIIATVWAGSLFFYKLGGCLDWLIFDPLFSPQDTKAHRLKRFWWTVLSPLRRVTDRLPITRKLGGTRKAAASKLNKAVSNNSENVAGIYKSAMRIFHRSEEWESQVKVFLDLSKAARAFVIPFLLLLLYSICHERKGWAPIPLLSTEPALNWLIDWRIDLTFALVFLLLSLWLRIVHMVALYHLIIEAEVFAFVVNPKVPQVPPDSKSYNILCIGSVVIPASQLPLFKTNAASSHDPASISESTEAKVINKAGAERKLT